MGFGLLLIGYFLVNIMTVYAPFAVAMPIGYAVMSFALYRLAPYHHFFFKTMLITLVGIPFGVYYALYGMITVGWLPQLAPFGSTAALIVEWCYFFFSLLFVLFLLRSIAALATDLGLLDMENIALRNMFFVGIYHLLYLIAHLPIPFFQEHQSIFTLPIMLIRYLCVFLNLWLFFRCYRNILPEGSEIIDDDIEKRKKRKRKGNKK